MKLPSIELPRSPVAWLATGLAGLGALLWWGHRSTPLPEPVEASIRGTFERGGVTPSRLRSPNGSVYWSSWQDDDANTGALELGPFIAPQTLGFYLVGYPGSAGNQLRLRNVATGETWSPDIADPAEAWAPVVLAMPSSWIGRPVSIQAVDGAEGRFGWLGLGEPFSVARSAGWWGGATRKVAVFVFSGLLVLLAATGSASMLRTLGITADETMLLLSCGMLALSGYFVFWVTFLSTTVGVVAAWLELLAAVGLAFAAARAGCNPWSCRDWRLAGLLALGIGAFYFGSLLLYPGGQSVSTLAQTRFAVNLPGDNTIPQRFAERLNQGLSPKHIAGGWRSSDRPPLQAGWTLLFMRPARALGVDYDTAAQAAGASFQLLWIPSVWCLLRRLGAGTPATAAIVVAIVPTGFLFLNSTFVWPKLGAAALVLGAFVFWYFPRDDSISPAVRRCIGGILAGLGWLAHAGVAFGLLALAPFIVWSCRDVRHIRSWLLAVLSAGLLAVPWLAYQTWYEPPGNQLLRWHLAGDQTPEKESTWDSLTEAYGGISFREWLHDRRENARLLVAGNWQMLWRFDFSDVPARRNSEAFVFFSLGWWNLGFAALLATPGIAAAQYRWTRDRARSWGLVAGWVLLTLLVWITLMFLPGTTLIHQGSYTVPLVLLPALGIALWRLHPLLVLFVAVAQAAGFVMLWLSPPGNAGSKAMNIEAALVAALSASCIAGVAFRQLRGD